MSVPPTTTGVPAATLAGAAESVSRLDVTAATPWCASGTRPWHVEQAPRSALCSAWQVVHVTPALGVALCTCSRPVSPVGLWHAVQVDEPNLLAR